MNNLDLLRKAQEGDEEAFNSFFSMNKGLVFSLLKRYDIKRSEYDDIVQEANYALCLAMKKYDFKYEVSFSTYAVPIILGEIRKYFRDNSSLKIGRGLKELSNKISDFLINNENISIDELAERFNESKEKILEAITLKSYVSSLDNTISEENDESIISNYSNESLSLNDRVSLQIGLDKLDKKERLIIEMRYFDGYSQTEISERLNISQVQVSRIESKVLGKLRELI